MSALGRVVRSGVGRRRVQTVVVALVVLIAVTSAVLGGTLLVASDGPFDRAFAQQHGAHLTAQFDAARSTTARLEASGRAAGVTASAGPFPLAVVTPDYGSRRPEEAITVVGRSGPGGAVDAVTLLSGRWATGPGEIVLNQDLRLPEMLQPKPGDVLDLRDLPGTPSLTVVGTARSVSETAGGWATAGQVAALVPPGGTGGYQMLYRYASAATAAQIDTHLAELRSLVGADAVTGTRSWLTTRQERTGNEKLFVPFLIAFGVLGVLMAVLIVGNVIAGAVSTGTRRIGILKALGFTPGQVVRAYLGQALIPAAAGAALGAVAGNLLAVGLLAETNRLYGTADTGVSLWLNAAVLGGALALVAATAWAAASRAGRLRTVDALSVGRTPTPGRGQWAARLFARLPVPRPVSLGLARPFARPLRSVTMVAAIAFGAAAVTFAVGLASSLQQIQATDNAGDVIVHPGRPATGPPPGQGPGPAAGPAPDPGPAVKLDAAAVGKVIAAQAGTGSYFGTASTEVTVAGLTKSVEARTFTGDTSGAGYQMVSGSWFAGPGEIVVATPFLTATHTEVSDTVLLTAGGKQVSARIVGEAFNTEDDGMEILTAAATLAGAEADPRSMEYTITLTAGTDPQAYAEKLDSALKPLDASAAPVNKETDEMLILLNSLTTLLTVLLIVVAALGVLNTLVLETRERVHDLGVHKALGMAPRQTVAMVIASIVVTGLAGGAVGAAVGVVLQRAVVTDMAGTAGFRLPASMIEVYAPAELVVFGLGGLAIAVLGALLPAGWAARTRTATALRTE